MILWCHPPSWLRWAPEIPGHMRSRASGSPTFTCFVWLYQHIPYLNSCHKHTAGEMTLHTTSLTCFSPYSLLGEQNLKSQFYINTSKLWDWRRAWLQLSLSKALAKSAAHMFVGAFGRCFWSSKALTRSSLWDSIPRMKVWLHGNADWRAHSTHSQFYQRGVVNGEEIKEPALIFPLCWEVLQKASTLGIKDFSLTGYKRTNALETSTSVKYS